MREFWIVITERDSYKSDRPAGGPLVWETRLLSKEEAEAKVVSLGGGYGWARTVRVLMADPDQPQTTGPIIDELANLVYRAREIISGADNVALTNGPLKVNTNWREKANAWLDEAAAALKTPRRIKPPLGCRPKFIVDEHRAQEIAEAICRFAKAGFKVKAELIEELADLVCEPEPAFATTPSTAPASVSVDDVNYVRDLIRDRCPAKPIPKDDPTSPAVLMRIAKGAEEAAALAGQAYLKTQDYEGRIGIRITSSID